MTREQALARVTAIRGGDRPLDGYQFREVLVDSLATLGLLKLEFVPEDPDKRLVTRLYAMFGNGPYYVDQIMRAIRENNLVLVDKGPRQDR